MADTLRDRVIESLANDFGWEGADMPFVGQIADCALAVVGDVCQPCGHAYADHEQTEGLSVGNLHCTWSLCLCGVQWADPELTAEVTPKLKGA